MGIAIKADRQSPLPHRVTITLVCDGAHRDLVGTQTDSHYIDAFKRWTSEGWLETRSDGERKFLCPECSGKRRPMRAASKDGLPFTYSKLDTYQSCPLQYFETYIAKTVKYVETPARAWGNKVDEALTKRIRAGVPLPVEMAKWEYWAEPFSMRSGVDIQVELGVLENGMPCDYWDENVFGRTKIDLNYERGDSTARIFDWKTGKRREDPWQLRVEALFVQARNPSIRDLAGWYVWLSEGPRGELGNPHDLSDVQRTWAEVQSIVADIRASAAHGDWPAKRNGLCKAHCDVFTCPNNGRKGPNGL